jgi:phosphoadenosine phosphosulfate reductase
MLHNPKSLTVSERVEQLNGSYAHHSATSVLERALGDPQVGRIGLISSFGADSVVLLHMISVMDRTTPVVFIDTEMLFPETLEYQIELTKRFRLSNMQVIRASDASIAQTDPDGTLHQRDTDSCCALRKTIPLQNALSQFDAWITGRKRFQSSTRATLDFFENEDDVRIKVNPLAHWAPENVREYMENNNLPSHPLVAKGYPSIGCAPCTSPVAEGEDPRSGRWRGQEKVECGIHFVNGKMVRGPVAANE